MSLFRAMELDIDPIQNYFGEKIALYFTYLQNFTSSLKLYSYFGVLLFFLDLFLLYKGNSEDLDFPGLKELDPTKKNPLVINIWMEWYHYVRMIFTVFVVIWTSVFLEYWKRKQKNFAIKFGQLEFKEKEQERPDFKGKYKRNLGSGSMNQRVYSAKKRQIKKIIGGLISFAIIICSVAVTLLLMWVKTEMLIFGFPVFLANTIAPLLNVISAKIFSYIYDVVSKKLNNYENHKSIS